VLLQSVAAGCSIEALALLLLLLLQVQQPFSPPKAQSAHTC
jgi:hypothetical protein